MVVRVGADPQAQSIVVDQVAVRDPVPSCIRSITILSPVAIFESASVLFPPRTTLWKSPAFLSKVIVAPSVSVTTAPFILAMFGVVRVLFVSVFDADIVSTTTPSTVITPADERAIVVSAFPISIVDTEKAWEVDPARAALVARSVLSAIVPSRSWKVYVLADVFVFVKKLVNVFATFLKFILKSVSQAYPPVASFSEVSCLSVLRFEKFVLVCVRKEFAVIQSFKVVIVAIGLN